MEDGEQYDPLRPTEMGTKHPRQLAITMKLKRCVLRLVGLQLDIDCAPKPFLVHTYLIMILDTLVSEMREAVKCLVLFRLPSDVSSSVYKYE